MTFARNLLLVSCAAAAGVHAGLVPSHLAESVPLAGLFAAAALGSAVVAALLARADDPRLPAALACALLAALLAGYALSRTAGLPLVGEDAEPVDLLGVLTQVLEAAGLAAAIRLCKPAGGSVPLAVGEEPS